MSETTLTATQVSNKVPDVTVAMQNHIDAYKGRALRLAAIADEGSIPLAVEVTAYVAAAARAHGAMRVLQIFASSLPQNIVSRVKLALDIAINDAEPSRVEAIWEAYLSLTTED